MRITLPVSGAVLAAFVLGACSGEDTAVPAEQGGFAGAAVVVSDTTIADVFEAAGTAGPVRAATLSTKLMGSVTDVLVREGERVGAGQVLMRLDSRDLEAKRAQVEAGLAEATAVHRDAAVQAGRIRALYADSAATKAQLDQAETGLARAEAAVTSARAMGAELAATASYAEVQAPFRGMVTHRFVDRGSFAAPGAPLVTVEDASVLRVTVSTAPDAIRGLRAGAAVMATIGGTAVMAEVEGVVPSGPNLYTVNALVPNGSGRFLSGSAATLALPQGVRRALLVPASAVVRDGDLTGVRTVAAAQPALRWVKLGRSVDGSIEVLSGLSAGDSVLANGGGR